MPKFIERTLVGVIAAILILLGIALQAAPFALALWFVLWLVGVA